MPFGWLAMLMTVFVAGLNAPSLPLLPLFTCAFAPRTRTPQTPFEEFFVS
jgi:hypothetical protein